MQVLLLESGSDSDSLMSSALLSSTLVDFSNHLLNTPELKDTTISFNQDVLLSKFDVRLDKFNNDIFNNDSLTDTDKQLLIENIVIRYTILRLNIEYSDELGDFTETD
ncbi:hypothetical protein QT971_30475, partial [Microcoleus sp. herbarium19]